MPKLSAKQSRARPPARHGKNEYREVRCQKDQCILSAQALREASNALLVSEAGMEKSRSRWLSSELRSLSCRLGMAHGDQVRALKASAVNRQAINDSLLAAAHERIAQKDATIKNLVGELGVERLEKAELAAEVQRLTARCEKERQVP